MPERATCSFAPTTPPALQVVAIASEFLHRDEWPNPAKFFRRARHAVPLLKIARPFSSVGFSLRRKLLAAKR